MIKIYSKYMPRTKGHVRVPEIRICGRFLEKYNFSEGQFVQVICEENKITIIGLTSPDNECEGTK